MSWIDLCHQCILVNNHQQSRSRIPSIGEFYRIRQSVKEVLETGMPIDNADQREECSFSSRSASSANLSGQSARWKPRSCLVLGHNDVCSSILLVTTFGGLSPTATDPMIFPHLTREELSDLLVPIHPTGAISSRRPITLAEYWPNMLSVLNTPHKRNHFLILKIIKIPIGTQMIGPMAEVVSNDDLMYIKSLLLDREIAGNQLAYPPGISSNLSSLADTSLPVPRTDLLYRDLEECYDSDDSGSSEGSSGLVFEYFRRMANSTHVSPALLKQRVEEWLRTTDDADLSLYE